MRKIYVNPYPRLESEDKDLEKRCFVDSTKKAEKIARYFNGDIRVVVGRPVKTFKLWHTTYYAIYEPPRWLKDMLLDATASVDLRLQNNAPVLQSVNSAMSIQDDLS